MGYYTWDNLDMCIATGVNQLTAWRNADVKLATGECVAADKFLGGMITLPHYITERRATGNYLRTRDTIGRRLGRYTGTHRLQTAQFCYWLMQACSTTENTPEGYNTHAITLNASTTPLNFGIHAQHKLSSEDLLWDLLGCLPSDLTIRCSESQNIATQVLTVPFAFAQTSSDDFTKTDRTLGTMGLIQKEWSHAVAGGLGPSQTAFTYNSNAVEVDIVGITIHIHRDVEFHARDSTHYPTIGVMHNAEYTVTLDVIPDGSDIWTIMNTEKASYAGDLDLNFKFQADATNDYIQFNYDKMYLVPIDKELTYNKATDSYSILLEPMSDASSLAVTGIDSLNNDHYENP